MFENEEEIKKKLLTRSKKLLIDLYLQECYEYGLTISDYKDEVEKLNKENKELKKQIKILKTKKT